MYEKIVVVTRKTRLTELIERFNSRGQAKFYIEHSGGDFNEYVQEDDNYRRSVEVVRRELEVGLKLQVIDRSFIPTFMFTEKDLVVAVGQDGLVANMGKYVGGQPIVAINPDPERFDGILLPFMPVQARLAVTAVIEQKAKYCAVTLAEVVLNDGQRLLAFNDLFIGAQTHISARYKLKIDARTEAQSSSGVLVSTGAGSTGWLSSVFNMASAVAAMTGGECKRGIKIGWDERKLVYVVREPFVSRHSQASLVAGILAEKQPLVLESLMPSAGVIFSDGVEADFIAFNAGAIATIQTASQQAQLVI